MSYADLRWKDRAACLGQPVELFHPEPGQAHFLVKGKEFCKRCTVVGECLAEVLREELPSHRVGLWGGLSARERKIRFDGRAS